jgi:hypothetical protein
MALPAFVGCASGAISRSNAAKTSAPAKRIGQTEQRMLCCRPKAGDGFVEQKQRE